MRSDLITPATRLQRATNQLQECWLEATQTWDDPVARRFQEKHLDPILPQMQLTLTAIHELMEVLNEAVDATADNDGSHS